MGQMQEQYLTKHKKLYLAFLDLEKAFDVFPERSFDKGENNESGWYTRTDCVRSKVYVLKLIKQGHNQ